MLRKSSTRPVVAATLTLVASAALTGCGLMEEKEPAQGKPSSPPSATSTPAAPSSSSSGSDDANTPRPSKSEVVAGMKKFYDKADPTNTYNHDDLANCIADKGYDKFSAATLNALKNGDPKAVDARDAATLGGIGAMCGSQLPSGGPSLPSIPTEVPTGIPTTLPKFPTDLPTASPAQ